MTTKSSTGSSSFADFKDSVFPIEQIPMDSAGPPIELQRVEQEDNRLIVKASWRSLFAFTTRQHAVPTASAVLASIFSGLIRPASAIIFGQLFNSLTDYGARAIHANEMLHRVTMWCIALTALGAATWIFEWAFLSLWLIFGELQAKTARQQIFVALFEKNVEWYDLREDGIASLLSRIETQIRELQLAISQPLGFLFLECTAAIASIGTALFFSWKLTLVILATFPIAAGLFTLISKPVGMAIERQKRELSRASKYANTAVSAINTVKAFNGEDQEVWQYFLTAKSITRYYLIQARANALQFGLIKFSAVVLYVAGFWYGLYLVIHGLDVGHVLTTFVSCAYAMQAVEIVLPQFLVLAKGISAGETLQSIMAEMQEGRTTTDQDGDLKPSACPGDIEINDISFAYPSNPKQNVLKNATFFFPAGETTFLVGQSGSGKSTIGNLLLKFYEAQSGEIIIDGHPIQTLNTDWLRQNITLVQQQAVLYNDTILQNIAFGTRECKTNHDIRLAARDGCIEQTIDEMPNGFDTLVGPKNRALSGGQSQRVAIARARLRNAPVLILDESTSALDQTSRIKVMERIRTWRKEKTTIIITHDVSQVLDNDYIYVLQNAKVVQEGYRKRLTEKSNGEFANFVQVDERSGASSSVGPEDLGTSFPDRIEFVDSHPHENHPRWSFFSSTLSAHDALSTSSGKSMYPPRNRVSMGPAMLTQANALLADAHWSSPVIPDSPVQNSRPNSFMPFTSPVMSPEIPVASFQSSGRNYHHQESPVLGSQSSRRPSPLNIDQSRKEPNASAKVRSKKESLQGLQLEQSLDQMPASLPMIFRSVLPALAWKDRVFLVLGLLASVVVGAATPAFSWIFSQLLQTFYIKENQIKLAEKWALCMLGIAFIDGTSCYFSHYFLEKAGQAWINSLRVESLRRILAQPKSWFDMERNTPSRLTECLDRDAEEMRNLLGRFVVITLTILTMLSITIVWAFVVEWKLTLVALSSAPAMYAVTRLYHWSSAKWEGKSDQACGATSSVFSETFSNIRVVRALSLENHFVRKHNEAIAKGFKIGKTRATVSGCMFGLTDSLIYYIVALVFYYGAVIVSSGDATVQKIFVVVNLLILGTGNAIGMFAMIPQFSSSRTTAAQVLQLVNLPLNISQESQGTKRLTNPFPIKFSNLSFTYPSQPHIKTLDNISLTINPGSCTAIVGPSGSGKSTVASLLLGLYPPDRTLGFLSSSALTFAGKSILDCNIHNIRSHMSIVQQTPLLFPTTVFSNIIYGLPETSPYNNLFAVERAAIDAGIHDFIISLENGYNTLIGEGGMGLSGGQAQRIAIARALVRRPKVLILDEATSALDAETAEGIREAVKRLRGNAGMAVVIISHNVDMMRIADSVIVIEDGKIVERGGFEELRTRGGVFERLLTGDGTKPYVERRNEGLGLGVDERYSTPVKPIAKVE